MPDAVPFANLWRKMSVYFFTDLTMTAAKLSKHLGDVITEGQKRWSWFMGLNKIGRQIVSWTIPKSRAFDAYVQLLSDR